MTNAAAHWEQVYQTKRFDAVSWYAPHLAESLRLIAALAPDLAAAVLDVGGGASTLVDDLLGRGYRQVSVLDLSETALDTSRQRLGACADAVDWRVADITRTDFGDQRFDLWHDRAVFHFLTDVTQRAIYVQRVRQALRPGGHLVMGVFGPDGPRQCSGLAVVRYDTPALQAEFGDSIHWVGHRTVWHDTPAGVRQQFLYGWGRRDRRG